MTTQMLAVLTALLMQYAPAGLSWAVHGFIDTLRTYLDKHPHLSAAFDGLANVARGLAPGDGAHAPDALKSWLREVLDGAKASVRNPMLAALFSTVESFVVDNLTDMLWSELFGANSEHPDGLVMAVRPLHPSECGDWHHSLILAANAVGNKWPSAEPAAAPENAPAA